MVERGWGAGLVAGWCSVKEGAVVDWGLVEGVAVEDQGLVEGGAVQAQVAAEAAKGWGVVEVTGWAAEEAAESTSLG